MQLVRYYLSVFRVYRLVHFIGECLYNPAVSNQKHLFSASDFFSTFFDLRLYVGLEKLHELVLEFGDAMKKYVIRLKVAFLYKKLLKSCLKAGHELVSRAGLPLVPHWLPFQTAFILVVPCSPPYAAIDPNEPQ